MPNSRIGVAKESISELTTARLSIYLRCLTILESHEQKTVSSHELAKKFDLNSAQIRKDLACFGEFGIRGVGYNVSALREHLVRTLGIDRLRRAVIIGAGNLGMALAGYRGFNSGGFHIVALLDHDPRKLERKTRTGIPIVAFDSLAEIVKRENVEIGIVAVPGESAQAVYDSLVDAGICAVLNFAPVQIKRRPRTRIRNVDLRIALESLSFHLKNVEDGTSDPEDDEDV